MGYIDMLIKRSVLCCPFILLAMVSMPAASSADNVKMMTVREYLNYDKCVPVSVREEMYGDYCDTDHEYIYEQMDGTVYVAEHGYFGENGKGRKWGWRYGQVKGLLYEGQVIKADGSVVSEKTGDSVRIEYHRAHGEMSETLVKIADGEGKIVTTVRTNAGNQLETITKYYIGAEGRTEYAIRYLYEGQINDGSGRRNEKDVISCGEEIYYQYGENGCVSDEIRIPVMFCTYCDPLFTYVTYEY